MNKHIKYGLMGMGLLMGVGLTHAQDLPKNTKEKEKINTVTMGSKEHILHALYEDNSLLDSMSLGKDADSLAFSNQYELKLFKDMLQYNSFIHPIFVEKEEFNKLKGEFLITKDKKNYDLYVPNTLKIGELASIIKKLNQIIYGKNLPSNSYSDVLRNNLEDVIIFLVNVKNEKNNDAVQKAISKYVKIFNEQYPGQSLDTSLIKKTTPQELLNKEFDPAKDMTRMENIIAENMYENLFLSIFEQGEELFVHMDGLNDKIGIENFKTQLKTARKIGDKKQIASIEKIALAKVLSEIKKLKFSPSEEMYRDSVLFASIPTKIMNDKKILCVGNSYLLHSLLKKLGIEHQGLSLFRHSAIMVQLSNGEELYCDMTKLGFQPLAISSLGKSGIRDKVKVEKSDTLLMMRGDPDKVILAQLIGNMSTIYRISDKKECIIQIEYMKEAIKLAPQSPMPYTATANLYFEIGEYKEALKYVDQALKLNPDFPLSRWLKSQICDKLGDNKGFTDNMVQYGKLKLLEKKKKEQKESEQKKNQQNKK